MSLLWSYSFTTDMSKEELAAFKAQIHYESNWDASLKENLNYSPFRIWVVFKNERLQGKSLMYLSYNPQALANTVYGGSWGKQHLGNIKPNDGWTYRGRGLIQLTGRYNYKFYGDKLNVDLINNPNLANDPIIALKIAKLYWNIKVKPNVKDFKDMRQVTKAINGGTLGLSQRQKYFDMYIKKDN